MTKGKAGTEKKTIYETLNDSVTKAFVTMSGEDTTQEIKVVDNIISFVGAAGGVGTTTLVANMAKLAEKMGLTVLIVDMNILFPGQNVLYRLEYKPNQPDLVSFLVGEREIGECLMRKKAHKNISILSAHNRQLVDYLNCDNDIAARNLETLLGKIKYEFDLILIDCPMTLDFDPVSSALYSSDAYYVVWDESVNCVTNYDSLTKLLTNIGINVTKVKAIMNKKTGLYYPKSTFKSLGIEVVGTLPYEISVVESALKGELYTVKGASFAQTAKDFMTNISEILDIILRNGGYGRNTSGQKTKKKVNIIDDTSQNIESPKQTNTDTTYIEDDGEDEIIYSVYNSEK